MIISLTCPLPHAPFLLLPLPVLQYYIFSVIQSLGTCHLHKSSYPALRNPGSQTARRRGCSACREGGHTRYTSSHYHLLPNTRRNRTTVPCTGLSWFRASRHSCCYDDDVEHQVTGPRVGWVRLWCLIWWGNRETATVRNVRTSPHVTYLVSGPKAPPLQGRSLKPWVQGSLASQTQPTPARIAFSITHGDTESDPRWGWLGLACETRVQGWCNVHWMHQSSFIHSHMENTVWFIHPLPFHFSLLKFIASISWKQ